MPLNRRGFFSAVSSAFAGAPATKALAAPAPSIPWRTGLPDEFRLPGWKIRWSGWKDSFNQSVQCGQWLAAPVNQYGKFDRERFPIYSSIPGGCMAYMPGHMFDISFTIGKPNYAERAFIKKCQRAGERFPVRRIQLQFPAEKRAR